MGEACHTHPGDTAEANMNVHVTYECVMSHIDVSYHT